MVHCYFSAQTFWYPSECLTFVKYVSMCHPFIFWVFLRLETHSWSVGCHSTLAITVLIIPTSQICLCWCTTYWEPTQKIKGWHIALRFARFALFCIILVYEPISKFFWDLIPPQWIIRILFYKIFRHIIFRKFFVYLNMSNSGFFSCRR